MSNRVVDIVERCLRETFCMTSGCEQTALAILAALESDGYRLMGRKPTYDVLTTLCDFFDWPYDKDHIELAKKATAALHDAAPRYGEPSG